MGKKSDSEQAFRQLAFSRRSVRDFLDTPVPAEVIESILSDAVSAPSWSNTRPYRFAVASGDTRDRISAALLDRAEDLLEIRSSKPLSRLRAALKAPGLLLSDFRIPVVYPKDLRQRQGQLGAALFGHLGVERSDRSGRGDFVKRNMEFFGRTASSTAPAAFLKIFTSSSRSRIRRLASRSQSSGIASESSITPRLICSRRHHRYAIDSDKPTRDKTSETERSESIRLMT